MLRQQLLALFLLSAPLAANPSETGTPEVTFTAASSSADETAGAVTVTVMLDTAQAGPVDVPFSLSGTAVNPDDYTVSASPLTIPAGATSADITVTIVDDLTDEPDETVVLTLGAPSIGSLGTTSEHTLTIVDNEAADVRFTFASSDGAEGAGSVGVQLKLSVVSSQDVTVPLLLSGTALSPDDYSLAANPVVIPAGSFDADVVLDLVDDAIDEPNETVILDIGVPVGAALGANPQHTFTILDDDLPPEVSFTAPAGSALEGAGTAVITVALSAPSLIPVDVPFSVTGGSAIDPDDFTLSASPLTIPALATSADITVTLVDDTTFEGDEDFDLTLGSPTGATLGAQTIHTFTLLEDDPAPTVSFDLATTSAGEGTGSAAITVLLDNPSILDVTVPFTVTAGSALDPDDYTLSASPLTILAGDLSGTITVTLVDDALFEGPETVELTLGTPTNASLGAQPTHVLTIDDDEGPPAVDFALATSSQGEETGAALVSVTLAGPSTAPVEVPFSVTGGSAIEGTDFSLSASPLTIPAGSLSADITVTLLDDPTFEGDETVELTLGVPTGGVAGTTQQVHTFTIVDDELTPEVGFVLATSESPETGGVVTIDVELTNAHTLPVTVPFTLGGSALEGTDYTLAPASPLTFAPGSVLQQLSVTLLDDADTEGDETVTVTLGSATNADPSPIQTHTLTIVDDDLPPEVGFTATAGSALEGAGTAVITVELSAPSTTPVDVPFSVTGGSAIDPDDFTLSASPLTIPALATSADITVTLVDDTTFEGDEDFQLTLGSPTGATLGAQTIHTFTLLEDDPAPTVTFDLATTSAGEGTGSAAITVLLDSPSILDVTVPFTVTAGSALDPDDYTLSASPLTILAGDLSGTITVTLVDDALFEGPETAELTLGTPTNATLGAQPTHVLTIDDDEGPPAVDFALAASSQGEETGAALVSVTLAGPSADPVDVPFSVTGGSATEGTDFSLSASPLTIPAGSLSADLSLTLLDDLEFEGNETVELTLGVPSGGVAGTTQQVHTFTILDDELTPEVGFVLATSESPEGGGVVTIDVQLTTAQTLPVTVPFTLGGSALEGTDYTLAPVSPLTFAPGSVLQQLSVTLLDDADIEGDETVTVTLGSATNADPGATQEHTLTIREDDLIAEFLMNASSADEGLGSVTITATLSAPFTSDVILDFDVSGSASSGADYTLGSNDIQILAGDTTGDLVVTLLEDTLDEIDEDIILQLLPPVDAALGTQVTYVLTVLDNDPGRPQINEFLASNQNGLVDEDGDTSDWVELTLTGPEPVDLDGWFLTDDAANLTKWMFPATLLTAGDHLIVFCSDKDRAIAGAELHTNFKISSAGEYLALVRPDGTTVAYEYAPSFPQQVSDVSYGIALGSTLETYFSPPTPGAPNGPGGVPLDAVEFSVPRGLYELSFPLILTSNIPIAEIYYTLDGTLPSAGNGTLYTGPLTISQTTVVRAVATGIGFFDSPPQTRTYIFKDEVFTQDTSYALARGFPAQWIDRNGLPWSAALNGTHPGAWYGFYTSFFAGLSQAEQHAMLEAIPTVSLTLPQEDWFGYDPANDQFGLYPNSQDQDSEFGGTLEWIEPGVREFGVGCGMQVQGNGSTRPQTRNQLSIAVMFKTEYGPAWLEEPLFDDSSANRFDYLVFDAGFQGSINEAVNSAAYAKKSRAQGVRDHFSMELQRLGGTGLEQHSRNVHLYINGLYWGVYLLHERADESFGAEYLPGDKSDFDYLKHGDLEEGNPNAWDDPVAPGAWATLIEVLTQGVAPGQLWNGEEAYGVVERRLDLDDYIDYVLLNFYFGNLDWPQNNWLAIARARVGAELTDVNPDWQFQLFSWDAENILQENAVASLVSDGLYDRTDLTSTDPTNALFAHTQLLANPEYVTRFGDRVWRMIRPDGPLHVDEEYAVFGTPFDPAFPERNRPAALYHAISQELEQVVTMEYARWGHHFLTNPAVTVMDWEEERRRLLEEYFPIRTNVFIDQLRTGPPVLYPSVNAPKIGHPGGCVPDQTAITISGDIGWTVYYTLDGSDPRAAGGAIAPGATPYTTPVVLTIAQTQVAMRSRQYNQSTQEWSPLADRGFAVGVKRVLLNELVADNDAGAVDEFGEFEDWIEIGNRAPHPVDISGWTLTDNPANPAKWTLPAGTVLPPKGRILVWCDEDGSQGPLHANFKLSRFGETLQLRLPESMGNAEMDAVTYPPLRRNRAYGRMRDLFGGFTYLPNPTPLLPNSFANQSGAGLLF